MEAAIKLKGAKVITLAFLLAQAVPTLTLSQVRALSPAAAGDAVLRNQQHGPIETFEAPTGGMNAPGTIDGQLVERPTTSSSACIRRVWTVQFRAAPGADIGTAKAQRTHSTQEIALSPNGVCPSGRYVHLNPGVDVDRGRKALTNLEKVIAKTSRTQFRCSDETHSGMCNSNKTAGAALRALKPWAISDRAGDTLIWLGVSGNVVTEVCFKSGELSQVVVERRVPAHF